MVEKPVETPLFQWMGRFVKKQREPPSAGPRKSRPKAASVAQQGFRLGR
jgi:hypothetical protein